VALIFKIISDKEFDDPPEKGRGKYEEIYRTLASGRCVQVPDDYDGMASLISALYATAKKRGYVASSKRLPNGMAFRWTKKPDSVRD
jgi:hypothetical protein